MILYLLPFFSSVIVGFLCLTRIVYFEEASSVVFSALSLAFSIWISVSPDFSNGFVYIDGLSKIMLVVISSVYLLTVIFSITYLKYIENPLFEKKFYFLLLNFFAATMLFSVSVNNLGLIWIGIEATTVTSALLVATENDSVSVEAAWRYIIIVSSGLAISLLSNIFIYGTTGTLEFSKLLAMTPDGKTAVLGAMMAVIGYGTKVGIFPMHSWLPDVHGKAPAPVSAMFSGVLLPVALYAVIRVFQIVRDPRVGTFAFVLGGVTVIFAASLISVQKRYKRMFAYSTMENMGMALIGISLGGYGLVGAVILITAHAFAKSSAFFLSGNILSRYKTTKIEEIRGISAKMPVTGYSLFFASMGVTGAPPFATFIGEMMIISKIFRDRGILAGIAVSIFLAVAFVALNYRTGRMIFSNPDTSDITERRVVGTTIPLVGIALSVLVIFFIPRISFLLSTMR